MDSIDFNIGDLVKLSEPYVSILEIRLGIGIIVGKFEDDWYSVKFPLVNLVNKRDKYSVRSKEIILISKVKQ